MVDERRGMKRFPMQLPVHVKLGRDAKRTWGITKDISVDGIYFYVDSEVDPNEIIEFTVTFPVEVTLTTPVRVRCTGSVIRADVDHARGTGIAAAIKRYEFLNAAEC